MPDKFRTVKRRNVECHIISPSLTNLALSRSLDIGFVLFLPFYGPLLRRGPEKGKREYGSRLVNSREL